jgi:hypothetical protein
MKLHDDLDIAVEAGEQPHQAIDGVFAEVALEHARHFGLADAHELSGCGLRELALIDEPVDFGNDLRFQEVGVRVGQAEIGKNVVASRLDFYFTDHDLLPEAAEARDPAATSRTAQAASACSTPITSR